MAMVITIIHLILKVYILQNKTYLDEKLVSTYGHDFSPIGQNTSQNQSDRESTDFSKAKRVLRFKDFCTPKNQTIPNSPKQIQQKGSFYQKSKCSHQFYTPAPSQKEILNQQLHDITQQNTKTLLENQAVNQKYLTETQEDIFKEQFNQLLDLIAIHQKEFPRILEENLSYFQHFLGLCECFTCDCGFCRCAYIISPKPLKLPLKNGLLSTYDKSYVGMNNQNNQDLQEMIKILNNYPTSNTVPQKQIDSDYQTENKALQRHNHLCPTPKFIPSKPLSETPFLSLSTYKSQFHDWKGSCQSIYHQPDQKRIYCQIQREGSLYQSSFQNAKNNSDQATKIQLKHIGPFQLFLPFLSSSENREKFKDRSYYNYIMNQNLQKEAIQKNNYPSPYIAQKSANQKTSEITTQLQKKYCASKFSSQTQTKEQVIELINNALLNRAKQNQFHIEN